jgi:hypothetical protein
LAVGVPAIAKKIKFGKRDRVSSEAQGCGRGGEGTG